MQIICHMLSSIDGKITFGKINGIESIDEVFGDYMDLYNLTQEKLGSNALLCGRVTMNMFAEAVGTALPDNNVEVPEELILPGEDGYFVVVDTKGMLRWKDNFISLDSPRLTTHKFNLVTIITKSTPKAYLAYLQQKQVSYIIGGDEEIDWANTFEKLQQFFQIERLILEGGGHINGSILASELIDEISLLLVPVVINNESTPSLFEHTVDVFKLHHFKLQGSEKLAKDVLWLKYVRS